MRLFVALSVPEAAADTLLDLQTDLAGAAWRPYENFHITLNFIGEADRRFAEDIDAALGEVCAAPFSLRLSGCGQFGDKRPRAVWAGVAPHTEVAALQAKTAQALRLAGVQLEARKFIPHVTLAYLKGAGAAETAHYAAAHSLYASPDFDVAAFHLYQSMTSDGLNRYEILSSHPLSMR
ncbi:MAG: RNA 2',3'-cyclic phosphodiesterase [Pseudomonadota bacterium]